MLAVGTIQATAALTNDMARKGRTMEFQRVLQSLDHHYIAALVGTRKFKLTGRSDLADLLKEQSLGASGIVDASTAAEQGKVLGAQYRLVVTLDHFLMENASMPPNPQGDIDTKRRFQLSAQTTIYDASTGAALEAANIQVEKTDIVTIPKGQASDAQRTDDLMPLLSRELAEKVANRTVDVIFPAKIIDKEDKLVTINRGDGSAIAVGEIWTVYGPEKTITDEDSGAVIKRKGALLGQVKITSVEPTYSQGEVLADSGIVKGAVVSKNNSQAAK